MIPIHNLGKVTCVHQKPGKVTCVRQNPGKVTWHLPEVPVVVYSVKLVDMVHGV